MIKKLCIFTSSFSPNKQAMLDYLKKILPESVDVFLFTPKDFKGEYKTNKIKKIETNSSKFVSFLELRKFCRKNKIERIINLGLLPYEGFAMIYACLSTKKDFIAYHLGNPIDSLYSDSFKMRLRAFFEIIISYSLSIFPKKIFLVSENQVKRIKKYLFFARKKIFLMPQPVPTSFFKPKSKILCRKRLKLNPKDKIIIFVGRIGYLKGSDILLYLIKTNPDKKFMLIGQIVDKGLEEQIKKLNFKNLVLIPHKNQEELVDYYNASDLCIFPSRIEGTPLVPREAMSCGTPAIVSKIQSTESLKEAAIIINLNAEKMNKAMNDFFNLSKKQKKEISNKSRKFIVEKFDDEKWKEIYVNNLFN